MLQLQLQPQPQGKMGTRPPSSSSPAPAVMGKRKSRTSKQPKLDTTFDCPFCNHTGSVECTIDLKHRLAEAVCGVCKEAYSTSAHALTEPVDVYSEWIDACEQANERARRGYADEDDVEEGL